MPRNKKDWLNDSERNIFLTGKAGTGKTYQIKKFVESEKEKGRIVLLSATTSTAAVNVGGQTSHSLFGIPVPCMGVPITKAPASQIKVLAKADTVVIDEVSMLRNDAFSFAARVLKKAEKIKGGKIRLVVTGDFSQLPPVVTKADEKLLEKFGYDKSGYPFTTKEWQSMNFKVVELTEIHRQEDEEFVEMLGKVRECDPSSLDYFNQFVDESYQIDVPCEMQEENGFVNNEFQDGDGYLSEEELARELLTPVVSNKEACLQGGVKPKLLTGESIVLCGTNAEAERINRAYLDTLPGTTHAYQSKTKGVVASGIVDDVVLLKDGCNVIFTVNDEKGRYQNGTLAKVERCLRDHVVVKLEDYKEDKRYIAVYPKEHTSYNYKVRGGELTKEKTGSVSQIPLKLAAAMTINKSQGKTFERAIIFPSCFAAGQLYVALSRVKSPNGLILTAPIKLSALVDNEVVSKFYSDGFTYEVKKTEKKASTKAKSVGNGGARNTASKKKSPKKSSSSKKLNNKEASSQGAKRPQTKGEKRPRTIPKASSSKKVSSKPKSATLSKPKGAKSSSRQKPKAKAR